jgi:hypothetical protein
MIRHGELQVHYILIHDLIQSYEYLTKKEIGANMVSIHFGHSIDYIQAGMYLVLLCFYSQRG